MMQTRSFNLKWMQNKMIINVINIININKAKKKKQTNNQQQQKTIQKHLKKYTSTYPENKMRARLLFPLNVRLSRRLFNFRFEFSELPVARYNDIETGKYRLMHNNITCISQQMKVFLSM